MQCFQGSRISRLCLFNIPVVYAAENRSLATLEFLVHVSLLFITPKNLGIACFEIPDDIIPEQITVTDLPKNWRDYPSPPELADLGSEWAVAKRSLLLRVPSVVVADEYSMKNINYFKLM